jgi:hypothetical protein
VNQTAETCAIQNARACVTICKMKAETSNSTPDLLQKEKTSSDYYWNSYAHYGIHEVCGSLGR